MAMDICEESDCYTFFRDFWSTSDCEWLAEHMRLMNSNLDKAELQQAACRCLQTRIDQNPSICNLIGEESIRLLPLHLSVLAVLNIHKDDIYVFHSACTAIARMALNSKTIQSYLVTKGAYVSIIEEMKKCPGEINILWPGYQALRALSFQNIYFEEMLVEYDVLSLLEHSLRNLREADVLKECIGLITCLANDLEKAMRQCVNCKIPLLIMSIALNDGAPEDLVTIAFEAIAVFYTSEDDHLLKIEYVLNIGKLMEQHESSNRIQALGCIIMQLISRETLFVANPNVVARMMIVIVEAMKRFPDDSSVQMEGCVAIYLLITHNEERSLLTKYMSVENRIHEPLFYIIESCSTEDDVTLRAFQTLQNIATEEKIKNILLQKASCCGFLKCVEYMILIGADVNAGSAESNPLVNAVSNNDFKLVQLLLHHNPSHTKPALQLSLQQENWQIAGILLRHIGYEAGSRIINWKDMNIEQLHPKLFLPILTSEGDLNEQDPLTMPPSPTDNLRRGYRARRKSSSFIDDMDVQADENRSKRSITTVNEMITPTGRDMETMSFSIMPYSNLDPRLHCNNAQEKYTNIHSSLNEVECADHFCPSGATSGSVLPPNMNRCLTPLIVMKSREDTRQSLPRSPHPNTRLCRSHSHMSIGSSISSISNTSLSNSLNSVGRVASVEVFCMPPTKQEAQQERITTFVAPSFDEHIGNIIKLLDISYNNISDLKILTNYPESDITYFLHHLEKLDLSNNKLFEIPLALSNCLAKLTTFNVSDNYLQNFPSEIMVHQKLESLNISGNKIVYIDHRNITQTCSLLKIDLSRNKLSQFPSWMSNVFPRLNRLFLSHNKITEITSLSDEFILLKELQINRNYIHNIDDTLFANCVRLEKINLSYNQLSILPNYIPKVSQIPHLSYINLSHNNIEGNNAFHMPIFLLSVPSLESIDLSYNNITELPQPQNWSSKRLIELIFSHNQVRNLNFSKNVGAMLPCLQRLNLSYNKLDCIPQETGLLTSLSSLDVSHNPITVIPDIIGRLSNLYNFPLNGLRLRNPAAVLKGTARDIVSYFGSKLKNAIPYRRIKLMLVGPPGRGKTSLVHCLAAIPNAAYNVSTVGIEVNNWILHPPKKYKKLPSFTMNTWDFAGQEDFYSTHQYFLSSRALYLAIYDLSRGNEDRNRDMEMLTPWLLSIKAAAPKAIVGIVGTHVDQIPAEVRKSYLKSCAGQLHEYSQNPGFPVIKFTAFVDSTSKGNRCMEYLRDSIYEAISGFTYEGQPITAQIVPKAYVDFEDMIREEARISSSENRLPMQTKKQLWQRTLDNGILLNREEFNRATKFLNDTGSLIHFNDPGCNLNDVYFIDPQWLSIMMARVVTIKEVNPFITEQGILSKADSFKLFPDTACYPKEFFDQYFKLLRKFEVVLPISDDKYLVTSKLPKSAPFNLNLSRKELLKLPETLVRRYVFPYFPNGFWARLIARMILYCDSLKMSEKVEPSEYKYWRSGMYTKWSADRYFLISTLPDKSNEFDIITTGKRKGYILLGSLVDIVDNLIEEWYPGLHDPLSQVVHRLCPCYNCSNYEYSHYFNLEDCITVSYKFETIVCPNCGPVLIAVLAPDVVFRDLDTDFIYKDIPVSGVGHEIGKGGFARVYKANVDGVDIAVKIFGNVDGENPNRLLRQEVDILRRLHHPSLISVVGVNLRPRMLLLEYAPLGNLQSMLASDLDLTKGIQHRIAIQIAEGLEYLHDNQIVYRDLKPSNVLVFSLSKEDLINVKLTDYGISQIATSLGLTASKGTLGYQAPEVALGDNEYNIEVDIFSFGATLYEILTGGKKPFGEIPSQYEFNKAVMVKKPIKTITSHGYAPWPDAEILVRRCLSGNPDMRPCVKEIRNVLLTVDFPCLKSVVAICKDQSVECIAIRQLQSCQTGMEIWVGSGASVATSQLSWFSVGGASKQNIQGMMMHGRILCMISFAHFIIIGTNGGLLRVYDAYQKKHSHTLTTLDDSILCLTLITRDGKIVAGLANGTIAVYNAHELVSEDAIPSIVDVNDLMKNNDHQEPITCITLTRDHILCGYGAYVCKIRLNDYTLRSSWQVSPILRSVVYSINVSKSNTFTSCKNSYVISVWDSDKSEAVCKIDCHEILWKSGYVVSKNDSRVLSMQIVDQNILWVGCDSGHIIIIDTLRANPQMLHVIWRYTSSVRVITMSTGAASCVVTGGVGFRQLLSADYEHFDHSGGCMLLWEADVAKQKKQLDNERKRREDLAIKISQNS